MHAVLTAEDVVEIRRLYRAGLAYKEIADKLGISDEATRHVLIGETWAHIPDPDGPIVMRRKGPTSEECHKTVLDWERVREIRRLRAEEGLTYVAIGRRFGVHPITVRDVVRGRTWKDRRCRNGRHNRTPGPARSTAGRGNPRRALRSHSARARAESHRGVCLQT